jgi:hypothetical protein
MNKETTLNKVKVGDLLFNSSTRRIFASRVTRVTDSMVFSCDYRLSVPDAGMINNPEYLKTIGLKGLKTWGDHWDGGASFPIQGNEKFLTLGPETKEKKTYKHRGVVRDSKAWIISEKEAEIKYDFYVR